MQTDYPRLERLIFIFLFLMVLFMPHSIAASQTAWLLGMFFLFIRILLKRNIQKTPLDKPLWTFFLWSLVTCIFSYTPLISIDKMRTVSIFLVFYFVVNVINSGAVAVFLTFALIFSCMINVIYVPIERIIGRGVQIHGLHHDSPLSKALLMEGDTLLKANEKKIYSPEDLVREIEVQEKTKIFFYRPDFYYTVEVKRDDLLSGTNPLEKLGIDSWSKSHNWRSTGFYGHWTTYAEVLQLIASLVFGIFVSLLSQFLSKKSKKSDSEKAELNEASSKDSSIEIPIAEKAVPFFSGIITVRRDVLLVIMAFFFVMMVLALILSGTRAPLFGLIVSAFLAALLTKNRKIFYLFVATVLLIMFAGAVYLKQSRHIGFIDENDDSTKYRQTIYKEALDLWISSPRHILFGIGMDSIKVYATEWKLFDNGRLPLGHFHSTPLQLLVERGIPAILIWAWIVFAYSKLLLEAIFNSNEVLRKGILLGIFGGMIGFLVSGMVHYNLGDQEVAAIFFFLMAIGVVLKKEELTAQVA
jgi:O-antigen ligase